MDIYVINFVYQQKNYMLDFEGKAKKIKNNKV